MNRALVWLFALLGASLLVAGVWTRLGQEPGSVEPILGGQAASGQAPDLPLVDRQGGEHKLSALRGRYLLVNFWATWCQPCLEELPHLAVLADALRDAPVSLVLVSVDEDWKAIDDLAGRLGRAGGHDPRGGQAMQVAAGLLEGKLPGVLLWRDPGERAAHAFGTFKYPETWLLDPEGRLRLRFVGAKPWGAREAIASLRAMLIPVPEFEARSP